MTFGAAAFFSFSTASCLQDNSAGKKFFEFSVFDHQQLTQHRPRMLPEKRSGQSVPAVWVREFHRSASHLVSTGAWVIESRKHLTNLCLRIVQYLGECSDL